MKIASIEHVPGAGERVHVHVDEGDPVDLAHEVLLVAGLGVGDFVTAERLAGLLREDQRWRAREAALQLLSYRPRTAAELRGRLLRKEIPGDVADACLADLHAKGLLDDSAFAEAYVRDRVRLNPRGRRRVVQELRGRGVDADTAASVVDGVMREEDVDELQLARDAARRWRPRAGEDPVRARRRLMGFLARRGFGGDTARQVVEETCSGE